jgi:hypothetical protein
MHRPTRTVAALAAAFFAVVISALTAHADDQTVASGTEPHDRICAQATFPDGTKSPLICIPNPL